MKPNRPFARDWRSYCRVCGALRCLCRATAIPPTTLFRRRGARALERAGQFRPGTRLDHWTFTILSSIWKNQLRANAIRRGNGHLDASIALTVDISSDLEANIMMRQVLSAVGRLPEAQRSVVMLVYVEGWTYKEAAAALDIPIGTVMSRLAAARKTLGGQLATPRKPVDDTADGGAP